jgi:spermidine/putrescine-binding protein
MAKKLTTPVTLILILVLVAACDFGTTTTPTPISGQSTGGMVQSVGEGEGAVSIVAWAGYIERGETDKAYDWVTGFENETGCKVSVKTAATSDEMVALMNEGGFDLVTASGDASLRLVAGEKVQEVNTALVPNYSKRRRSPYGAAGHDRDRSGESSRSPRCRRPPAS